MREEFEMEKSKWGGAEQGLMEYDGGRGQRESQEVGSDFMTAMVVN